MQLLCPISKFQGAHIFEEAYILLPFPILAPQILSTKIRHVLNKGRLKG